MLTFQYVARNPTTGEKIKSTIQADSESSAVKTLKANNLTPISVKEGGGGLSGVLDKLSHVKAKDRVLFARQLSTLINAGLPLVQSLRSTNMQTQSKPLKTVVNAVITDVEAGSTFADALAKYPKVFNQVFINLVAAGETSGTLDTALERLALQQEKDAAIVSKIRGAMIYPLIVLGVMMLVLGFMLVKVLPQVQILYNGLPGAKMPEVTVILLGMSNFIIKRWYVVMVALVLIAFGLNRFGATNTGRYMFDKLKMRMPPFGPLFMKMYMARFTRTSSTLISSGVPLIQVLEITGRSVNNVRLNDSIKAAIEKVKSGKSIGDAITGDPNFLELVPNMLRIGEQSGSIEQMLGKTADYYENEVDEQIKGISTIIEPVLMVVLGIAAFIIVAAVLLPVYSLAGNIGGIAG